MCDREDVPGFNETWLSFFKGNPPATTIIPTANPGFGINALRIEINTISLALAGNTKREVIKGPEAPAFDGYVSAIKCGDLLFLSGLYALKNGRLIDEAKVDERQPFYGIPVKAELRAIIEQAEAICRSAGTTLRNAVRIQQLHTSLADLPAAIEVWNEAMDGAPLPLSPVEVAVAGGPRRAGSGRSLGVRAGSVIRKSGRRFSEKITLQTRNLSEFICRFSANPPCRRSRRTSPCPAESRRRPARAMCPSTRWPVPRTS